MATKHPRVSAVVERSLFEAIDALAKREGLSLSQKMRDLLRHAVELEEDVQLETLVEQRRKNPARDITHQAFWKRRSIA